MKTKVYEYYKVAPVMAMIFTGANLADIIEFTGGKAYHHHDHFYIKTLEGSLEFWPGYYVVRNITGEFYASEPHIFAETYRRGIGQEEEVCPICGRKASI